MKYIYLIIVICLAASVAHSQDEFALTNTHCFGNNGIDDIKYQFETPDGSTVALVSVEHQSGYFQCDYDSSIWLVKFDNHLNIVAKSLISQETAYSHYFGYKFKINKVSNTILCIVDSSIGNVSFINRLLIFDYNLNKLSTININERKTFEPQLDANKDGGYVVKYNVYDSNYTPDSMAIVLVNTDGSLRFKKYIDYSQIDTFKHLAYTPTTNYSTPYWLANIIFDSNVFYTTSIVYFWEPTSSQKIGLVGMTLDTNLNVIHAKLIENKFSEGSGSGRYRLYQLNDTSFLYSYNENLNSMRLYFLNNKFDTISPSFIADNSSNYNYILDNQLEYYFGQNPFNIQISNNLVYVPYFYKLDSCPDSTPCYYSSKILCFDFNGQLLKEFKLDNITNGLQKKILDYKILNDLSILVIIENATGNGFDYIVSKFIETGNHIWSYTLPRERKWQNSSLNYTDLLLVPQISSISGKERTIQLFRQYKNANFAEYDTIQLWNFELNLDNGQQLDSSNLTTIIEDRQNNYLLKWNKAKKISENEFVVLGTSNILCNDNDINIFTSVASKKYNTITSRVFLDLNGNSILDNSEHYLSNVSIVVTKNNTTTESYFSENGYIVSFTDTGKYVIKVNHNYNYYIASPDSVLKNYTDFGNTDTLNFALQPVAIVNDLMVQLNNNGRGRPGFNGSYLINVLNNGTTVKNAVVMLNLANTLDSIYTVPSATLNNDTLFWSLNNLDPSEQRTIELYFHYKEPPVNNIGDTIISTAIILPVVNDTFPDNNVSVLKDVLSGSFDPNDKVTDKDQYSLDDLNKQHYIKYTIRFENTGNDTAFSIVITDTLDSSLDVTSFIPLKGKYFYTTKITNGNVLTFTFNPIRLPAHTTSAVSYLVKPKNSITNGVSVRNKASIKFDYNEPIVTNTTQTIISSLTGYHNNTNLSSGLKLYPNPAKDEIAIEFSKQNTIQFIQVFDIFGHIIHSVSFNNSETIIKLNIHDLIPGMYILTIIDKNGDVESVKFSLVR